MNVVFPRSVFTLSDIAVEKRGARRQTFAWSVVAILALEWTALAVAAFAFIGGACAFWFG